MPAGALLLRSDRLTPDELADEVLARLQGPVRLTPAELPDELLTWVRDPSG